MIKGSSGWFNLPPWGFDPMKDPAQAFLILRRAPFGEAFVIQWKWNWYAKL
jgi:hypothetical protein